MFSNIFLVKIELSFYFNLFITKKHWLDTNAFVILNAHYVVFNWTKKNLQLLATPSVTSVKTTK